MQSSKQLYCSQKLTEVKSTTKRIWQHKKPFSHQTKSTRQQLRTASQIKGHMITMMYSNDYINDDIRAIAVSSGPSLAEPVAIDTDTRKRCLRKGMTPLPAEFAPSNYSVLCGRGKGVYNAVGNRRLRVIVSSFLTQYVEANNKPNEKSSIIAKVVAIVKDACPVGAFVKYDSSSERYYELSDRAAHEKCGALFRDCLQAQNQKQSRQPRSRSFVSRSPSVGSTNTAMTMPTPNVTKSISQNELECIASCASRSSSTRGSFYDVDTNRSVSIDGNEDIDHDKVINLDSLLLGHDLFVLPQAQIDMSLREDSMYDPLLVPTFI